MTIEITYAPNFFKLLARLEKNIQEETLGKIYLFENKENHKSLKVHNLKGRMEKLHSFSVTHNHRIIFEYGKNKNYVYFLEVGAHDLYKQ